MDDDLFMQPLFYRVACQWLKNRKGQIHNFMRDRKQMPSKTAVKKIYEQTFFNRSEDIWQMARPLSMGCKIDKSTEMDPSIKKVAKRAKRLRLESLKSNRFKGVNSIKPYLESKHFVGTHIIPVVPQLHEEKDAKADESESLYCLNYEKKAEYYLNVHVSSFEKR